MSINLQHHNQYIFFLVCDCSYPSCFSVCGEKRQPIRFKVNYTSNAMEKVILGSNFSQRESSIVNHKHRLIGAWYELQAFQISNAIYRSRCWLPPACFRKEVNCSARSKKNGKLYWVRSCVGAAWRREELERHNGVGGEGERRELGAAAEAKKV